MTQLPQDQPTCVTDASFIKPKCSRPGIDCWLLSAKDEVALPILLDEIKTQLANYSIKNVVRVLCATSQLTK